MSDKKDNNDNQKKPLNEVNRNSSSGKFLIRESSKAPTQQQNPPRPPKKN
jgi:hypothetical protein